MTSLDAQKQPKEASKKSGQEKMWGARTSLTKGSWGYDKDGDLTQFTNVSRIGYDYWVTVILNGEPLSCAISRKDFQSSTVLTSVMGKRLINED